MSKQLIHQHNTADGLIEVWQDGDKRSLWFDNVILQSEIYTSDPAVLPNTANQAMLAHLMFGQQPEKVLLAGCGGGAIARWFNARSPKTKGDAVELSEAVVQIAMDWFDFPNTDTQWQLQYSDIRDFVKQENHGYDFILADLEENQHSPDWLTSRAFLTDCKAQLSAQGVLTLNLIPRDAGHYIEALWGIREVFNKHTFSLPVSDRNNQIIMAFQEPPDLSKVLTHMDAAAKQWGLQFSHNWRDIQQNNPIGSGIR